MKILAETAIERGSIMRRSASQSEEYRLRMLDTHDLPAILKLQDAVAASLRLRELYVPIPAEELAFMLEGGGEVLGLLIEDQLFAACALLLQVKEADNMARELEFAEDQLPLVAQLELSLVHPELQGYKLQQKLAGILAERVQARGDSRYLFTTVSPYNYPSIATLMTLELWVAKLGKMYYDWDRYVVYRDFWHPVRLDTAQAIWLPVTCRDEQQALLAQGYRGFAVSRDKEGIKTAYAPVIPEPDQR